MGCPEGRPAQTLQMRSGRTEGMAAVREVNSFECSVCGETMETWNSAWVPTYRLIAGPIRQPSG